MWGSGVSIHTKGSPQLLLIKYKVDEVSVCDNLVVVGDV